MEDFKYAVLAAVTRTVNGVSTLRINNIQVCWAMFVHISHGVESWRDKRPCIQINKSLAVYRFSSFYI